MFPKRRKPKERGRERWPIISMGIIMGASHQMGPMNCFRYSNAVLPYAVVVGQHEDGEGAGEGRVDVVRGRHENRVRARRGC